MSNVEPFPIRHCLHYLDCIRANIEAQPANKRKAYTRQVIEQHRAFLTGAGVEPWLIERECRNLELAVSTPPTPNGGLRRAA